MNKIFYRFGFVAALVFSTGTTLFGQSPSMQAPTRMVQVAARETNGLIHFYAVNNTLAPVTTTFDFHLKNLKSSVPLPCTLTLNGSETSEIFTLTQVKTNKQWKYDYTYSSIMGSATAVHDDFYVYSLPYSAGSAFSVSQGYHGRFSHTGSEEYAIDWSMPIGTTVCAAREGLVVKCKEDSNIGGPSHQFETNANYILVEHSDGTIAIYGHLQQGGVKVKVGDHVKAGEPIALSGDTGFTHGPHLHFSVFKAKDGTQRQSLPVKFRSADKGIVTLRYGQSYTATPNTKLAGAFADLASSK